MLPYAIGCKSRRLRPSGKVGRPAKTGAGQAQAFTLVELLVTLAIIATLAALLFPVFARAREAARKSACLTNEKQIGSALMLYAQDYDEALPPRQDAATLTSWRSALLPYTRSKALFTCPSNPNARLTTACNPETANDPAGIGVSYALSTNDANGVGSICNNHLGVVTLARVGSPAQVIGVAETTTYYSDFNVTVPAGAFTSDNATGWNGHLFAGHNNMTNFLFMDGHVKSMKPLATLNPPMRTQEEASPLCLWTLDNSSLTTTSSTVRSGSDYENAFAILDYAQNGARKF